jgi:hypothetical protein
MKAWEVRNFNDDPDILQTYIYKLPGGLQLFLDEPVWEGKYWHFNVSFERRNRSIYGSTLDQTGLTVEELQQMALRWTAETFWDWSAFIRVDALSAVKKKKHG